MKNFLKTLLWIVIIGAVLFGIYYVLPEYPQNFIKSFVQPIVNSEAKTRIQQVQNLAVEGVDGQTYKTVLEKNTGMSCWVYETREEEPGLEYVIYMGNGASVNMKDYTDYKGKLYTSCEVKFEFKITGNSVEIYPYLDGVKMNIEDGQHVEQNKEVRKIILQQLYGGVQSE